jgi:polyhydroxybutyrate depolymerase
MPDGIDADGPAVRLPSLLVLAVAAVLPGCSTSNDVTPTDVSPTAVSPTAVTAAAVSSAEPTTAAVAAPASCRPPVSGRREVTISVGGRDRRVLLDVPPTTAGAARPAAIVHFHGHGGTAAAVAARHGIAPLATRDGVVAAYPQALVLADGKTGWAAGAPNRNPDGIDDVAFVAALLDRLVSDVCVDPDRIVATGHSNGGGMVALLACRMPGRLHAAVAVAAAIYDAPADCASGRGLAFEEIHGLADRTVPYDGAGHLAAIRSWLEGQAERIGCSGEPVATALGDRARRLSWLCPAGGRLEHLVIDGQGHDWPDRAPAEIWRFAGLGRPAG